MRPLTRKLFRDLWRLRAQSAAVVALLAIGIGMLVSSLGMKTSLGESRDAYYRDDRLSDLQLQLVRAPMRLTERIASLPGVQAIDARVAAPALLGLPGIDEQITAKLLSLDVPDKTPVNQPWLVQGRWPEPLLGSQEIVVNQAFMEAHGLQPGDTLAATIRGGRETFKIVGMANSPEFVFVSPPGQMFPQPDRYALIWMLRPALEQAADLDGAFNDLVLRLSPNADVAAIKASLQSLLGRYGAQTAQGRDRIPSARFLDQELDQLATMAKLIPPAFLAVAAFLLNVALTRLVEAERANIGLLKAFGFLPGEVALNYLGMSLVLVILGMVLGAALAQYLGEMMAALYLKVYRLPSLPFETTWDAWLIAVAVASLAGLAGSINAVRRVLKLSAAAALMPAPPPAFQHGSRLFERLTRQFDALTRVVLRRILGFPRRSLTTIAGVVCALSLLILARQFPIAIQQLLEVSFDHARRQDLSLTLIEAGGTDTLQALRRLPGTIQIEPFRNVPALFRYRTQSADEAIVGLMPDAELERLVDFNGLPQRVRDDGLIITQGLARQLGAGVGDRIDVKITTGRQVDLQLPVLAVVTVSAGNNAYVSLSQLGEVLQEPGRIGGAHVRIDPAELPAFHQAVREMPIVAGVSDLKRARASLARTFEEGAGVMTGIFVTFAVLMSVGIAFATSSVTLAEQRRDLATLQVLGFSRREVSYVLLAEIGVLTLLSLPLGVLIGHWFAMAFLKAMATDLFTFPMRFEPAAYAASAAIVLAAIIGASLLVRREIDRINLVESLKSRE
ncbi:ABC transporter permease [Ahniella affigens]|uniref:ABC transporter permease n=1 Tax=Ahniella affigens TaxID=2021234 RepID=UPI00147498C6|nr:ABC transporter permease [Ahniella affigens]